MRLQLVNLLLFSDKRKNFLLLLAKGPRTIDDALYLLQVSRISLLPQIKKLKEEGLIVQEGDVCRLSTIGEILIKKVRPLVDASILFEENEYFWSQRKLSSIPFCLLKRIGELKGCQLVEPGASQGFDLFPDLVNYFIGVPKVMLLFSYFHPYIPSFSLDLAKKGVELRLIFSEDLFERFSTDFQSKGETILAQENAAIFVRLENTTEIPSVIAVSENKLLLGLFNKKGGFEGQYLLGSESGALNWGKELFEHYIEGSRKISSMEFL